MGVDFPWFLAFKGLFEGLLSLLCVRATLVGVLSSTCEALFSPGFAFGYLDSKVGMMHIPS